MKHLFFILKSPKSDIKSIDGSYLTGHKLDELAIALLLAHVHAFTQARVIETLGVVKSEKCTHWPLVIGKGVKALVLLAFFGWSEEVCGSA